MTDKLGLHSLRHRHRHRHRSAGEGSYDGSDWLSNNIANKV
ncbi:unnamed protein product [Musa acuminata subsp. malaccensis]|uniref:(wild Malaysian banana) hypothetical protein n=1 Tax=Musa acuminata subsp. malaccensis TaxID=214687 RepID=A0A804K3F8_MUSAM|nr:unnamed protein product [Musa acuminata subsp. malaccensis]